MHLGSLSIHLFTGRIEIGDLTIDGLRNGDRPFFTAKRLVLPIDWRRRSR